MALKYAYILLTLLLPMLNIARVNWHFATAKVKGGGENENGFLNAKTHVRTSNDLLASYIQQKLVNEYKGRRKEIKRSDCPSDKKARNSSSETDSHLMQGEG